MNPWDKEGINERMRELVEDGNSFAQVAHTINKEFGTSFSRSAIIGRSARQGLSQPRKRGRIAKPRVPKQKMRGAVADNMVRTILAKREPPAVIIDDQIPLEQRKTLLELTSETCRWPVGEGADLFFCGALPLPTGPYCAAHHVRAHSQPPRISDHERDRRRFALLRVMTKPEGKPFTFAKTHGDEEAA